LALAAGGDLEALNCQPAPKLNRSTNLRLSTSPPLEANACWQLGFGYSFVIPSNSLGKFFLR